MAHVLAEHQGQVALIEDQGPVRQQNLSSHNETEFPSGTPLAF
jgi:hypothetical protein